MKEATPSPRLFFRKNLDSGTKKRVKVCMRWWHESTLTHRVEGAEELCISCVFQSHRPK